MIENEIPIDLPFINDISFITEHSSNFDYTVASTSEGYETHNLTWWYSPSLVLFFFLLVILFIADRTITEIIIRLRK